MMRLLTSPHFFRAWNAVWMAVTFGIMFGFRLTDGALFWFVACSVVFLIATTVGLWWLKRRSDAQQQRVS